MARVRLGLLVLASTAFLLFAPAAKAALVTLDIFGFGSGSLNSVGFENQAFNFHLEGLDGNSTTIQLTTAEFTLFNGPTVSLSGPTQVGLNFGPDYAFFRPDTGNGGLSGTDDLVRLFFSPADFQTLQHANLFFGSTTLTFPSFVNVATSGGPLTFASATNTTLLVVAPELAGSAPELSTWAMMLIGFAGVGFLAWRRAKKVPVSI